MTLMGKIAFGATIAFISSVLTLLVVFLLTPAPTGSRAATSPVPAAASAVTAPPGTAVPAPTGLPPTPTGVGAAPQPAATPTAAATPAPAAASLRQISLAELSEHNNLESCWKAISGLVYDVTAYIPRHPTSPAVMLEWCGKDATAGWLDKGGGRPHSPRATALLEPMLIGELVPR